MKVLVVFACLLVAANALFPAWGLYGLYNPALMYGALYAPYLYGSMALAGMYSPLAYGALGMGALGGLGWYKKKK